MLNNFAVTFLQKAAKMLHIALRKVLGFFFLKKKNQQYHSCWDIGSRCEQPHSAAEPIFQGLFEDNRQPSKYICQTWEIPENLGVEFEDDKVWAKERA